METLARAANRGSISTGYDIDNSCKFENANSEALIRNADGNADDRTKFSFSGWYKRTQITRENWMFASHYSSLKFMGDDTLRLELYTGSATSYWDTTIKFRDTSAWYHIVFAVDTTLSTAADRVKVWVNGVFITNTNTGTAIAQHATTQFGTDANNYQIGYYYAGGSNWRGHCGYMADLHYVDGIINDADNFGEYDDDSGIWVPKEYTGGYGTNGFNLKFENSSNMGIDSSGNSNTYSLTNITAADQATDTPTNNFCTLNPLAALDPVPVVITEGGTVGTTSSGGNIIDHSSGTMGFSSGKWYFEAYITSGSTSDDAMFGFGRPGLHLGTDGQSPGYDTYSIGAHNVGRWYYNSGTYTTTGATAWDKAQIIQIAMDCDNGKCWSGVNGTYTSGNPSTNTGGFDWNTNVTDMSIGDLLIPVTRVLYTAPGTTYYNFGGYTAISIASAASDGNGYGTFEYAPPTGFYALCTKNLAEYG